MKKLLLVLMVFVLAQTGRAQTDSAAIQKAIQQAADSMSAAFTARDWKGLLHFMPPAMIAEAGGEETFIGIMETAMEQVPDTAIKSFSIGPVLQTVKVMAGWQCVIRQRLNLSMSGMQISSVTSLVGQSDKSGLRWTFFDCKGDRKTALHYLPTLSPALRIPASAQTVNGQAASKKSPAPAAKKPVQRSRRS